MTRDVYRAMCKEAERVIRDEWKLKPSSVRLVSGGSAWADHVAVDLYLKSRSPFHAAAPAGSASTANDSKYGGLTLYLPCSIMSSTSVSAPGHMFATATHYGKRLNELHRAFSRRAKARPGASIGDMMDAKMFGAVLHTDTKGGFLGRNTRIAEDAQYLLAFTWDQNAPAAGSGTADTWNKARATSTCKFIKHVSLTTLCPATAAAAVSCLHHGGKRKRQVDDM